MLRAEELRRENLEKWSRKEKPWIGDKQSDCPTKKDKDKKNFCQRHVDGLDEFRFVVHKFSIYAKQRFAKILF